MSIRPRPERMTFKKLVSSINSVHKELTAQVGRAVNVAVTMRNWSIGRHIAEYEQHGTDRAQYAARLLERLSARLSAKGMDGVAPRTLRLCRLFYQTYPMIWQTVSAKSRSIGKNTIWQTLSAKSSAIRETASPESGSLSIVETAAPQSSQWGQDLVAKLSFSHIAELLEIDDDHRRAYYESECIRGGWSVRELRRQIASLYFERSGLSRDKKRLSALTRRKAEKNPPKLEIRDPYIFEFLGLKAREVMGESHLEDQLLDRLQDFLLELGHGFCFEARQKRILIGEKHGFVDLVFYHRVLKCHVLIEMKLEEFSHENIGQLNTYVTWYRKNMMARGDNPPVGILLCAKKDHALAEYALAGMDNKLFVSKYQLHLPKRAHLERFVERRMKERLP